MSPAGDVSEEIKGRTLRRRERTDQPVKEGHCGGDNKGERDAEADRSAGVGRDQSGQIRREGTEAVRPEHVVEGRVFPQVPAPAKEAHENVLGGKMSVKDGSHL